LKNHEIEKFVVKLKMTKHYYKTMS